MEQLDYIANLLYGKDYHELEPHQQYEVREALNNKDY